MRPSFSLVVLVTSAIALVDASAAAQQPKAGEAAPKVAASTGGKKEIKRDPEGKRGISPYMELIAKGEAAFVARDMMGAVSTFQDAIKLDADKMLGFYRLGEALLASGKTEDAEATWQTALGKKGTDELNGKVLFVLADLRERQQKWQAAKDAWAAYAAFLTSHPKALGYPATGVERQKQADRRMKDEVDYAVVKARIAKRKAEVDAEATENAKKDKLNR
jgi:tetratricopeptide (TPR) repeat protein